MLGHRKRALNVSWRTSALAVGDRPKDGTNTNRKKKADELSLCLGSLLCRQVDKSTSRLGCQPVTCQPGELGLIGGLSLALSSVWWCMVPSWGTGTLSGILRLSRIYLLLVTRQRQELEASCPSLASRLRASSADLTMRVHGHLLACVALTCPTAASVTNASAWDEGPRASTKLRVVVTCRDGGEATTSPNGTAQGHGVVHSLIVHPFRSWRCPTCLPIPSPEHGWIKKGLHGGVRYHSVRNGAWPLLVYVLFFQADGAALHTTAGRVHSERIYARAQHAR